MFRQFYNNAKRPDKASKYQYRMKSCVFLALLFFAVSLCASAQTFTPSSCTMTQPQGGPVAYPTIGSPACAFTITDSGTYTLSSSCCRPEVRWANANGAQISSVTGPATIYATVISPGGDANNNTPGSYPTGGTFCCGDLKIGPTTVPFTLIVTASMKPVYSNALRVSDSALTGFGGAACTNTGTTNQWDYLDTCTLSTLAVNGYTPPADGASYTDQIFGTTIWKLAGVRHDYAVVNLFSSDDQYVLVGGTVNAYAVDTPTALPHTGIYSTSTKQKVYNTPCQEFTDCGGGQWSNLHPDRLYKIGAGGTGWHQYRLGTAPHLIDDGLIYTPPSGELLDDGGSSTLTPEDYKVHFEYVAPTITSISGGVITISPAVSWLAPGKVVYFSGVSGDAGLHGAWAIATAPDSTHFTITGHTPTDGATASLKIYDHLVVVDLENRTAGKANVVISQPWETAIPSMPIYARGAHISPKDSVTGKWYVIIPYDYSELNESPVHAARIISFKKGDATFSFESYPLASSEGQPPSFIPLTPTCSPTIASTAPIGTCYTSAHSTELNVNGTAYMARAGGRGDPFQEFAIAYRLNAANDSAQTLYFGGGFAYWNMGAVDHMCGARLAPFLATSGDFNPVYPAGNIESVSGNTYTTFEPFLFQPGDTVFIGVDPYSIGTDATLDGSYPVQTVSTKSVTAATNAKPPVFTSTGHGFPVGSTPHLALSGATGVNWSTANGIHPATIIDANTFSLNDLDSSSWGALTGTVLVNSYTFTLTKTPSSYTVKSAIVYKAGNDVNINGGREEIHVARILPDGRVLQVRRIAKNLSTQFAASNHDNGYSNSFSADDYYAQPQVTLSPNGCWVGWASNLMHGNRNSFYLASTGFCGNLDPDQFTPTTRVTAAPLATSALFRATSLPDVSQSYKIEVATDTAISAGLIQSTATAAALLAGTSVTGLSASTRYCWRARSLDDYYVATGCFSTPAAPVGNSTLSMSGLAPTGTANAVIEYGLTSGLGSTSSAVTCSAGQQCAPSVSLARGSVYYRRIDFRDGSNTVLSSSPIEQIAIP